jgi:hypothetical protein
MPLATERIAHAVDSLIRRTAPLAECRSFGAAAILNGGLSSSTIGRFKDTLSDEHLR